MILHKKKKPGPRSTMLRLRRALRLIVQTCEAHTPCRKACGAAHEVLGIAEAALAGKEPEEGIQ